MKKWNQNFKVVYTFNLVIVLPRIEEKVKDEHKELCSKHAYQDIIQDNENFSRKWLITLWDSWEMKYNAAIIKNHVMKEY